MPKRAAVLLLAAMGAASCASQPPGVEPAAERSSLLGMIYDHDSLPCAGAEVSVDGAAGPTTDIRGRFILPDLSLGNHVLEARKKGYEDLSVSFSFRNRTDVLYARMISFSQLLAMAEKALDENRWDEAGAFLDRAERLDGADPVLLYLRALHAFRKGRNEEAVGRLEAILSGGRREAYVYLLLADIYERRLGDPARAVENLALYLERRTDPEAEKRLEALRKKLTKPQ